MIKEIAFFLRHGPSVGCRQTSMGKVEFQNWLTAHVDEDGMASPRATLVEGLRGEVVEIGCGSGAMFPYYVDAIVCATVGSHPWNASNSTPQPLQRPFPMSLSWRKNKWRIGQSE